jgi:hypothetical protein
MALAQGDLDWSTALFEETMELYKKIENRWGVGSVLSHQGVIPLSRGEHERAARYFEEALARVPADATVFAHRGRQIMAAVGAVYDRSDQAPVHEAWVSAFAAALRQGAPDVYVNFLGDEGEERIREANPGSIWERLAAIKCRYDPTSSGSIRT